MADFVNIPLGYNIPTQIPLDVKTYVSNEDELKNLGFANQKVFKYYKGLIIYCIEENTRYEWNEVTVDNDGSGLLDSNYTYPINHSAFGINYSNKTYNFFKVIFNSSILDGSETKLEAGTNIEIQGDGTIASPYIISADVITSETSIADGDNTTVEGSGSTLDPYRINVELPLPQDGSETKLVSGENIIISGNGTQLSPYVISGKNIDGSETKIQAGSNVTISGNGTIASPYIIHSLSSSTPNNITYLVSSDTATITGDGSSVTPYSVNVIPSDGSDTIITEGDNIIIEGIGTQSEPYIISVADHTHLISDITDLQNQLNSKANINHFHNISDIINLQSFLNNKEDKNQKGIANGYTPLDSNNKVPLIHINDSLIGNVNYQGLWNPTTNVPNLTTVGPKGHYYICTADGNRFGIDFKTGDWIISDGTSWSKVDNTDAVSTVFGRTGNVVAQLGDYTTAQVTENTNKNYQTDNQKLFNDATSSIQTQLNSKVNKSGIENSLPILDLAGNNLGAIETNDDHVSLKGSTGVLLDAPSTVVNSLSGYQDYLVGVGLDGQLIPVKRDAGLYAPTATNATVQNLLANTPTKMNALITLTQAMTSPTLQWSVNFSNTSNQATTVRIKLGLNNVATGTGILYTVPRFTSLTITGASPYAPTIASGTEVSAFIESSVVASVNSVTIKLDSGVSALQLKTVGGQSLLGAGNVTEVQNSLTASTILAPSVDAVNTGLASKIGLTSLSASTPLSYNNLTGAFSIQQANTSQSGFLSSTDWNTFNGKQNVLTNPVTGTGTANFISKWTAAGAQGISQVFDNGTSVGIGTTIPIGKFNIRTATTSNFDVASQPNGSISFGNVGTNELPYIASKSSTAVGGFLVVSSVQDVNNTGYDFRFDVRKNDNLDFSTLSIPAFKFTRFNNDLLTIMRNGRVLFNTTTDNLTDLVQINGSAIATGYKIPSGLATQALSANGSTIDLSSNVTGTGVAGQVSFWNGTNVQSGDSGLIWDNTNKIFNVKNINASLTSRFLLKNDLDVGILLLTYNSTYASASLLGIGAGGTVISSGTTGDLALSTQTVTNIRFGTNSLERGRLTSAGRWLFGTTTDNLTDLVQINGSAIANAWKVTGGLVTDYQTGTGTVVDFATTVRGTVLTGYSAGTNTALAATDTLLAAMGKIQGQITARENTITAGTTLQYYRGDKTFQTLNTAAVAELTNLYYTNARGIGSVLTGYVSGAGTIAATDTILQAIQKLNGNDVLKAPLASPAFTGVPTAPTATLGDNTTQIATTAFVLANTNANAVLLTGDQTISGIKTLVNSTNESRLQLTNSSTSTREVLRLINPSGSAVNGSEFYNSSNTSGKGAIYINSSGSGNGLLSEISSGASNTNAIRVEVSGVSSINDATVFNASTTSNLVNHLAFKVNNVNVATVSKSGVVTANSFIKSGGTANQMLMADGSTRDYSTLPTYADNAAAITGGLAVGALYRTIIGLLAVRF